MPASRASVCLDCVVWKRYTKGMISHRDCAHPKTKAARARCRGAKNKVEEVRRQEVITDYGTFEIKMVAARDITKQDMVLHRPKTLLPFFSGVTYDAFQIKRRNRQTLAIEATDSWRLELGGPPKFVPGDKEFEVAADPEAVKEAIHRHRL